MFFRYSKKIRDFWGFAKKNSNTLDFGFFGIFLSEVFGIKYSKSPGFEIWELWSRKIHSKATSVLKTFSLFVIIFPKNSWKSDSIYFSLYSLIFNRKLICLGFNRKWDELAFFHNLYNDFGHESISASNRKFIFAVLNVMPRVFFRKYLEKKSKFWAIPDLNSSDIFKF